MDEVHLNRINAALDLLLQRVEHGITKASVKELEPLAHIVMDLYQFKVQIQGMSEREVMNENLMKEVTNMIKRGTPPDIIGGTNLP